MKAVLQRVSSADIVINGVPGGELPKGGLVVLLGVEQGDQLQDVPLLAEKIANLRIFEDENQKLNLSLQQQGGGIMVVPNFTLAANCRKGRRPSFENSAERQLANTCFEQMVAYFKQLGISTVAGEFGADMQVSLTNDGPVTLVITTQELLAPKRGNK